MSGMGQLQPTRMTQGSCLAISSFTELLHLVLLWVPETENFPGIDSVLIRKAVDQLLKVIFYIDDTFSGLESFWLGYNLMENKLIPRLSWVQLRLSLKKMYRSLTNTVTLGLNHKAGGKLVTKTEKCEKLKFPVPKVATGVRRLKIATGIARNWVKNFAEIKRPMTRLTGNVEFI